MAQRAGEVELPQAAFQKQPLSQLRRQLSYEASLGKAPQTAGRKSPLIGEVAQRAGEVEFPRGDLKTTPQGSKKRGCCIKTASF